MNTRALMLLAVDLEMKVEAFLPFSLICVSFRLEVTSRAAYDQTKKIQGLVGLFMSWV
jgi:hypothetical protein